MPLGISSQEKICLQELASARASDYAQRMSENQLAQNIRALRRHLRLNQTEFGERIGSAQANVSKWENGTTPDADPLERMAQLAGCSISEFKRQPWKAASPRAMDDVLTAADGSDIAMVGIRHADAAFGLGATFTDEPLEVEVLPFPKIWVQSITYAPAEMLSWVRARGRSMEPTISDGDMILLDHSERKVEDQDDIWAFTVGETRAIKRLRVKGDRFVILSDNPSVPDDEEPIDFVNIVARVVFIGKRT